MLQKIQTELKAPKGQTNAFGKYKYRSCEDILEAVKPILAKHGAYLTISDEMVEVGGRVYVKATASLIKDQVVFASVSGYAREAENKKGMDDAQITGAASSYARKYALNGLFCIDDTKDADATNDHGKGDKDFQNPHENAGADNEAKKNAYKDRLLKATTINQVDSIMMEAEKEWSAWPDAWQNGLNSLSAKREAALKK